MENVVEILCNVVFFIIGCGIGGYLLYLLSRFPTKYEHSDNVKRWLGY